MDGSAKRRHHHPYDPSGGTDSPFPDAATGHTVGTAARSHARPPA
jgi:hypothetical protein